MILFSKIYPTLERAEKESQKAGNKLIGIEVNTKGWYYIYEDNTTTSDGSSKARKAMYENHTKKHHSHAERGRF